MTSLEILKKAIAKAVKNGYSAYARNFKEGSLDNRSMPEVINGLLEEHGEALIFSHDFAKAFFGRKRRMYLVNGNEMNATIDGGEAWKAHLQQMVLESEPINYLEKFL